MIRSDDTGKLVLRLALGILILLHGVAKLSSGVGFVSSQLVAHGLPAALAYLVYIGEIIAPVLIIVGIYTRPAAWVMVINMLFAVGLVHMKQLTMLDKNGGWALELQGMFLFAALAVAFLGAGRFSVGGTSGKYN
ncbi:DoxX family protein [Variovorax sp. J22G21]|uniref:DoxX family protein n=1 Tax=Variovorax fucosicus TaxID=3053517 RepID=UPI0025771638|nr:MULTISPECIES: DoxX family protein [unclassified Variovorax]MDM0041363.1 DoxX family protein [Variovorax sp. J22R193]MDM0057727.1 DoxX family protein [Variovorax sp. J22G47]MDM0060420.1 DoxX family protein [Variovorax sp. J22G21]